MGRKKYLMRLYEAMSFYERISILRSAGMNGQRATRPDGENRANSLRTCFYRNSLMSRESCDEAAYTTKVLIPSLVYRATSPR